MPCIHILSKPIKVVKKKMWKVNLDYWTSWSYFEILFFQSLANFDIIHNFQPFQTATLQQIRVYLFRSPALKNCLMYIRFYINSYRNLYGYLVHIKGQIIIRWDILSIVKSKHIQHCRINRTFNMVHSIHEVIHYVLICLQKETVG